MNAGNPVETSLLEREAGTLMVTWGFGRIAGCGSACSVRSGFKTSPIAIALGLYVTSETAHGTGSWSPIRGTPYRAELGGILSRDHNRARLGSNDGASRQAVMHRQWCDSLSAAA